MAYSKSKFSRTTGHKESLEINLIKSLIIYKKIVTTLQKAKMLQKIIEPFFTKSKIDSLHNRRIILSRLRNDKHKDGTHPVLQELFSVIRPKILNRNGGYTRVTKLNTTSIHNAEISLVDF